MGRRPWPPFRTLGSGRARNPATPPRLVVASNRVPAPDVVDVSPIREELARRVPAAELIEVGYLEGPRLL